MLEISEFPVDAAEETKMPNSKMNKRTFSKDKEETMATVVKGFEAMNLPLTRRKFLSIVKKEKERKSEFLFVLLFLCCR